MRLLITSVLAIAVATACLAQEPGIEALPTSCTDGAFGTATPESFATLTASDVDAIVKAAASALNVDTATIAVVDRAGRVLALFRQPHADPANDDRAVGVARTAAFFSHNMAPLSSRTVRFISGVHFPPGVINAPNAALYGIENTNRGCDLHTTFNATKDVPPARSTNGNPCNAFDTSGCGTGIVTGKQLPDDGPYPQSVGNRSVNAGGIPLYRILDATRADDGVIKDGKVVGGIGVVGIDGDPQRAEYAAVTGAFGALGSAGGPIAPVPQYPLPFPGNVFIDGIRLPFLGAEQLLRFNNDGLPIGLEPPDRASAGTTNGSYVIAASPGGCADNGYLAGPTAGSLVSQSAVDGVVQRAIAAAKKTRGIIRLPLNSYARMVIAVADLDGTILALYRMPDASVFSIDVAVAKARNVIWFSSGHDLSGVGAATAVTNRTIGFGAQPLYPPGIDSKVFGVAPGPFYSLFLHDLANACSQGSQPPNANQNGIVFFAGATPLFANGKLIGGLGVSGDGVEQDDYVTYLGAGNLLPSTKTWADQLKVNGVRLPMFKFPRSPEGVTECAGKPCS
ncbi:MAG TPA: heme-binding protein [Thermoanaerobaculia bacterium]|jgi:uncharacterized protein GlcG (DUF336 family)|nr:heme-binding protein [Thermoanaerobaculia bacterium]